MKISVITPFYEGADYMQQYVQCMEANQDNLKLQGHELEVILVNDSPWKKLECGAADNQYIKVITNPENKGIHYSRVSGLSQATGDYVMFLDGDDKLAAGLLPIAMDGIDDEDIVYFEVKDKLESLGIPAEALKWGGLWP